MGSGRASAVGAYAERRRSSASTLSEPEMSQPSAQKPAHLKPSYRSVYADTVREKAKEVKHPRDMFGLADYKATVSTKDWLKKGAFDERFAILSSVKYQPDRSVFKAPVPKDRGVIKPPADCDYVHENVDEIIHTAPGKVPPPPRFFKNKPTYGKQPHYLLRFRQEAEQKILDAEVKAKKDAAEALARQGYAPLPESERVRILQGLKVNLEKMTLEYGKISMVVDTIGKIRRKTNLEQQMTQLDRDIAVLSNPAVSEENPILIDVGPELALQIRERGWEAVGVKVFE